MGFEFRDDTKTLDINGHTFEILVGDIEALAAGEELAARLKKINDTFLGPNLSDSIPQGICIAAYVQKYTELRYPILPPTSSTISRPTTATDILCR